jgi:hypothetical protein
MFCIESVRVGTLDSDWLILRSAPVEKRHHGGLPDADAPAHDLHNGSDAVCCATRARNNLSGTPRELIHRVDHRDRRS